jgi:hypothetical protein
MRSWTKVWLTSTIGFPLQVGSLSGRSEDDFKHTLELMRLSYLRYALKTASDSRGLLEPESEDLHLNPRFRSLLEPFMPKTAKVSTGPFPA